MYETLTLFPIFSFSGVSSTSTCYMAVFLTCCNHNGNHDNLKQWLIHRFLQIKVDFIKENSHARCETSDDTLTREQDHRKQI